MYKVYNISWAGLKNHVATFNTLKECKTFLNEHKDYSLKVYDSFTKKEISI